MNRSPYLILFCTMLVIGCSNHNEKANEIFVAASRLLESGEEEQALEKLELIIEKHPKSDLAVKLVQGEARIGTYTYQGLKLMSKYMKAASDINQISMALNMYAADNGGHPTSEQGLQALIKMPTSPPKPINWNGPYVTTDSLDPWGNKYIYVSPSMHEGYDFDMHSCGTDGQTGGGDDVTNWISH